MNISYQEFAEGVTLATNSSEHKPGDVFTKEGLSFNYTGEVLIGGEIFVCIENQLWGTPSIVKGSEFENEFKKSSLQGVLLSENVLHKFYPLIEGLPGTESAPEEPSN